MATLYMKDLGVVFITYYDFDNGEDDDTEKESIIILNVCFFLIEPFLEINIFFTRPLYRKRLIYDQYIQGN